MTVLARQRNKILGSIVFAILIAVLVFRPQGLLGEQTPEGA